MIAGIVTAILLTAFVGGCLWAYSPKRHAAFDSAARMALDEPVDAAAPARGNTP